MVELGIGNKAERVNLGEIVTRSVKVVAGTRNRLDLQLRLLTTVALEQGLATALSSSLECPL